MDGVEAGAFPPRGLLGGIHPDPMLFLAGFCNSCRIVARAHPEGAEVLIASHRRNKYLGSIALLEGTSPHASKALGFT